MHDVTTSRYKLPALSDCLTMCIPDTLDPRRVTSPHDRVDAALRRVAYTWGTDMRGWHSQISWNHVKVVAYVGPRFTPVAEASHADLMIALRLLAWELEELCPC